MTLQHCLFIKQQVFTDIPNSASKQQLHRIATICIFSSVGKKVEKAFGNGSIITLIWFRNWARNHRSYHKDSSSHMYNCSIN